MLYSVGPIDIDANQVVELRYQAGFQPTGGTNVVSKIIRATSPTATTGVEVQKGLTRRMHPSYVYNNIIHSTAEQSTTMLTGQYYNVVILRTSGASTVPIKDWGELEAVKR